VSRRILTLLFTFVLCLACQRGEQRVQAPLPPVDDNQPQDGGTLIRRLDVDIAGFNPIIASSRYDRYVHDYLFTPLIRFDQHLQPAPGLATAWEISDDGLVYRFHLNKKATFSDGTPVRASDVVFTLAKIVDPKSEAAQIAGEFDQVDLTKTRAIDDNTVDVTFRQPLAAQLDHFNDLLVMPEHVYSKGDFRNDFISKAVGSGAYRLVRRVAGREIVVTKRADYWEDPPHVQTVIFKIITDHATAWNALQRGELDETIVASDTWLREHNNPLLTKSIDFQRFYTRNYNYIAWNGRHPVLKDKRVRRALTMCIPIDAVINDIFHGTARAMTGPFTPDEWAYNAAVPVIRYDPEGAKKLLGEAGWSDSNGDGIVDHNGAPLKLELIILAGSGSTYQFAQMVQAEFKKIGVPLDLTVLDGASGIQRILAGNYEAAYLSWDLDPDPDPFALFHSSQFPPHGQNFVFYANPAADRLIEAGRREIDRTKRKEIYHQLHALLADDQPYTWTVQSSAKWGINKRVRDVTISPGYGLFLWHPGPFGWWLRPGPQPSARR
jgi:peptide/nickel transport system substrate-binding protein